MRYVRVPTHRHLRCRTETEQTWSNFYMLFQWQDLFS